jgi:hypothetical protein
MTATTTALNRVFVGDRVIAAWRATATTPARSCAALAIFAAASSALSVGASRCAPATAVALGLTLTLGGAAALVDLHEHRLPNRLLAGALAGIGVAALVATLDGAGGGLGAAGAGLLLGGLPLLVVRIRRGLGMGDVKLGAVLGAAGGLVHPFVAAAATFLAALAAGGVGALLHRRRLALGPWWWSAWVVATVIALQLGAAR